MVSVICVYNNKRQFEEMLSDSLEKQNIEYELIAVDNRNQEYSSAAKALNVGAGRANGDVLVFSHQDIQLKKPDELGMFADLIMQLEKGAIVGAQGAVEREKENVSNITAGSVYDGKTVNNIQEALVMSCIDEGFFGMKKETYDSLLFDELLCDDWHLYAVEMCLHTRKLGGKVYVSPIQLHHFSWGHISRKYMLCMLRLAKTYRKQFKYIWTTCYKVRTGRVYLYGLYYLWCANRILRRKGLD